MSDKKTTRRGRDTTGAKRQSKRYQDLKRRILAAGWTSQAALLTAFKKGVVAVPQNPDKRVDATE